MIRELVYIWRNTCRANGIYTIYTIWDGVYIHVVQYLKKMKLGIILIIVFLFFTDIQAQDSERWIGDKEYAEKQLDLALKVDYDRTKMNFKLIPHKEFAIKYAELILFEHYGKEQIEFEKPYQVYLIDDYWIIFGTIPKKNYKGGVFELVIDSWNGKIMRLSHGK